MNKDRFCLSYLVFCLRFGLLALTIGCQSNITMAGNEMTLKDINQVMEAHTDELMALPGVVGVYVGTLDDGTPCIKVLVVKLTIELEKKIPKELEGFPVVVVETGDIVPYSDTSCR